MEADQAIKPKFDAVDWLRKQQAVFDAGGASKDRRAEQAADELAALRRAFQSLSRAIECEGYEIHVSVIDGACSVRPRD